MNLSDSWGVRSTKVLKPSAGWGDSALATFSDGLRKASEPDEVGGVVVGACCGKERGGRWLNETGGKYKSGSHPASDSGSTTPTTTKGAFVVVELVHGGSHL